MRKIAYNFATGNNETDLQAWKTWALFLEAGNR
jgi:hypothetical protein